MSIEYFAETFIPATENHIKQVTAFLQNNCDFEILNQQDDNKITLRFKDIPKREKWTEDITIVFDDCSVCIAVHSGNMQQRESFLEIISNLLSSVGLPCKFEEN